MDLRATGYISQHLNPGKGCDVLLMLKRIERQLELGLQPLLGEFGLTIEQWQIMAALSAESGQPMSVLAQSAVLPAASLTRHVDKLVERGLVLRRIHASDKRRVITALSPVGSTVADRLNAAQRELEGILSKYFQMEIQERSSSATLR